MSLWLKTDCTRKHLTGAMSFHYTILNNKNYNKILVPHRCTVRLTLTSKTLKSFQQDLKKELFNIVDKLKLI